MRIPRFYQNCTLKLGETISLEERIVKHVIQVLRLSEGRELIIFNGIKGEYHGKIIEASKRNVRVSLYKFNDLNREHDLTIHLAQCISKGDRFDFALQKSIELGVSEITPILSKRSQIKINPERLQKKISHWQKIIISACEQSGRTKIAQLNSPRTLSDFLNEHASDELSSKLILDPQSSKPLSSFESNQAYSLLIGPEGGFEDEEIQQANLSGFFSARLGQQILRTETAPIAAISVISAMNRIF